MFKSFILFLASFGMFSGCVTPLVTKAIESNYKTAVPDGAYEITNVFERKFEGETSLIVCFIGKLAYKSTESVYSIESLLKKGEFIDSVTTLDRSAIKNGCVPTGEYSQVSITDEYPHDEENVWYANATKFTTPSNSPGCRTLESNSLGCHGSAMQKITFVFIEKEKYRGVNFDPTYVLYAPAVVADVILAPFILVVSVVAFTSATR